MTFLSLLQWFRRVCPFKCDLAVEIGRARVALTMEAKLKD